MERETVKTIKKRRQDLEFIRMRFITEKGLIKILGRRYDGKLRLNLGCYNNIREGYINLDKEKHNDKTDVIHDLEEFPYPFKDNTFDEILCRCVLEHLNADRLKIYQELHRIGKNGCIIKITVPFENKILRYPEHKGTMFSFQHFRRLVYDGKGGYRAIKEDFKLLKLDHTPTKFAKYFIPKWLRVKLSCFLNEIVEDIIVELEVIKSKR